MNHYVGKTSLLQPQAVSNAYRATVGNPVKHGIHTGSGRPETSPLRDQKRSGVADVKACPRGAPKT